MEDASVAEELERELVGLANTGDTEKLSNLLLKGCEIGNPGLIRRCVEAGADVNIWDRGHSLLTVVCGLELGSRDKVEAEAQQGAKEAAHLENDLVETARFLIQSGARVSEQNPGGFPFVRTTPLIEASKFGRMALVKLLLEEGAAVNSVDQFGCTAFMAATEWGMAALMDLLIEHGADIYRVDRFGKTAMSIACGKARPDLVEYLYEREASFLSDDRTALMEACDCGSWDEAVEHSRLAVARFLIDHGVDVNHRGVWGFTALIHAAHSGRLALVELLLASGADVNAVSRQGTALSLSLQRG